MGTCSSRSASNRDALVSCRRQMHPCKARPVLPSFRPRPDQPFFSIALSLHIPLAQSAPVSTARTLNEPRNRRWGGSIGIPDATSAGLLSNDARKSATGRLFLAGADARFSASSYQGFGEGPPRLSLRPNRKSVSGVSSVAARIPCIPPITASANRLMVSVVAQSEFGSAQL